MTPPGPEYSITCIYVNGGLALKIDKVDVFGMQDLFELLCSLHCIALSFFLVSTPSPPKLILVEDESACTLHSHHSNVNIIFSSHLAHPIVDLVGLIS